MTALAPVLTLVAALAAGEQAPDVALPATTGGQLRLADFQGKSAVLVAFFPAVFSGGCTTQLTGYRDDLARFEAAGVTILAVSTDSPFAQKAYAEAYKLPFALLSDQDQQAMKAFGVPALREHYATRAVYLIDRSGKVAYANPAYTVGKSEGELMAAIDALGKAKKPALRP